MAEATDTTWPVGGSEVSNPTDKKGPSPPPQLLSPTQQPGYSSIACLLHVGPLMLGRATATGRTYLGPGKTPRWRTRSARKPAAAEDSGCPHAPAPRFAPPDTSPPMAPGASARVLSGSSTGLDPCGRKPNQPRRADGDDDLRGLGPRPGLWASYRCHEQARRYSGGDFPHPDAPSPLLVDAGAVAQSHLDPASIIPACAASRQLQHCRICCRHPHRTPHYHRTTPSPRGTNGQLS